MKKLILHNIQEVDIDKGAFIKQNAFIKPDGTFFLAKGYTGCNPWHQLESSALWIGRQDIGYDFIEKYEKFLESMEADVEKYKRYLEKLREFSRVIGATKLYDKRSVLVHYYGFALFCRTEFIEAWNNRDKFYEQSLIPNPDIYGKTLTDEQQVTLEKLFDINDGQFICSHGMGRRITDKDEMLQLVLANKNHGGRWHC